MFHVKQGDHTIQQFVLDYVLLDNFLLNVLQDSTDVQNMWVMWISPIL